MAGVIKVNGKYHTEELVHRDLFFKVVTPATTAQADFDATMQEVSLTSTVEVIGIYISDEDVLEAAAQVPPVVIVATATANIVISGANVEQGIDAAGVPLAAGVLNNGAIADLAGF